MRFFFDVRNDGTLAVDDIGLDFVDLKSAIRQAADVLAENSEDMFLGILMKDLSVEIRDNFGAIVMTVTLALRTMKPPLPL